MVLQTKINKSAKEYSVHFHHNHQKVKELQKLLKQKGGSRAAAPPPKKKLPVRKRIELLKDKDSTFLEFSPLAGQGLYREQTPAGGLVTGIALVQNRPCMIIANDPQVKGGTYFPITVKKHLRAQEIALQNHLPCLYLVDSGGAFLPLQDQLFADKEGFGRIFYNQVQMSALGIAQLSVVLGYATAGGAYVPALSDENIIVKGQGAVFLAGPPLVEAATGEKVSAQDLGGAWLHTHSSGVSDYQVDNEEQAFETLRDRVKNLNPPTKRGGQDLKPPEEPLYPAEEIYGLLPQNLKTPVDMYEVIARLVDGSEFFEFKKNFGSTLITGWARWGGHPVGVIANQGVLFPRSALKAAHFIDLCDQRGQALVFLQNTHGFMVGSQYEKEGIAKQGAKMVTAVSLSRVPKFTIIVGASYGAGNYGMCGRAYGPHQLWMWPTARIAVMGGPQAQTVLHTLKKKKNSAAGPVPVKGGESLMDQYDRQSTALYSTARLWDDGIVSPVDTRKVISLGLDASVYAPLKPPVKGIYRM